MPGKYTVRLMRREELDTAVEWAEREGWNPGRFDAASYFSADPEGFFAGELDGKLISTISLVKYGDAFAFLGFYIVAPEFRGRGFGLQIWQEACRSAGSRTVGLDGVMAQQENYRKSGFVFQYSHIRCRGVAGETAAAPDGRLEPLSALPFETLAAYDAIHFGAERKGFLAGWIGQSESRGLLIRSAPGKPAGYGIIRPAAQGWRIGPLFADTPKLADTLLCGLIRELPPGTEFFIDIPETNGNAEALVRRHRLEPGFKTARMYANGTLTLPVSEIYGTTTLELG